MYQKVLLTGKVVEILQQGTLVEVKNSYTPKDGSAVRVQKAYVFIRDEDPEYEVDNLILVKGRFIPNTAGNPPVDKNSNPRFIVKAQTVLVLGAYLDDLIDNDLFEIEFIGNCGGDPVTRQTKSGKNVTNLSVGVNVSLGADGKETCWFSLVDWGDRLSSFRKGELIYATGLVDYDPETGLPHSFQGQDGSIRSKFEVKFPYVLHLAPKNGSEHTTPPPPPEPDDIPF